jgi:hypothetical protein
VTLSNSDGFHTAAGDALGGVEAMVAFADAQLLPQTPAESSAIDDGAFELVFGTTSAADTAGDAPSAGGTDWDRSAATPTGTITDAATGLVVEEGGFGDERDDSSTRCSSENMLRISAPQALDDGGFGGDGDLMGPEQEDALNPFSTAAGYMPPSPELDTTEAGEWTGATGTDSLWQAHPSSTRAAAAAAAAASGAGMGEQLPTEWPPNDAVARHSGAGAMAQSIAGGLASLTIKAAASSGRALFGGWSRFTTSGGGAGGAGGGVLGPEAGKAEPIGHGDDDQGGAGGPIADGFDADGSAGALVAAPRPGGIAGMLGPDATGYGNLGAKLTGETSPLPPLNEMAATSTADADHVAEVRERARAGKARRRERSRPHALARALGSLWDRDVEIDYPDIAMGPRIGSGGFAEVFQAVYSGGEVAVKLLLRRPGAAGEKAEEDFKAEVALLARLEHPNIVAFIGVCPDPLALVTEFCARGNLFDLLHAEDLELPWRLRVSFALDAARGMRFLHSRSPVVIHRDLKSLNLLVSAEWRVKVSDFGLSRFKAQSSSGSLYTAQCGTFHWMAPEVIAGHRYTEKADVFSFGVNLWELFTRDTPYKGMQPMQVGLAVLHRGLRPRVPGECPAMWSALMRACWRADPSRRPSFAQLVPALEKLLRAEGGDPKAGMVPTGVDAAADAAAAADAEEARDAAEGASMSRQTPVARRRDILAGTGRSQRQAKHDRGGGAGTGGTADDSESVATSDSASVAANRGTRRAELPETDAPPTKARFGRLGRKTSRRRDPAGSTAGDTTGLMHEPDSRPATTARSDWDEFD